MDAESIKIQYFRQQIEKGVHDILEAQKLIATERIYQKGADRVREKRNGSTVRSRSGALMEALTNPNYHFNQDGHGLVTETTLPLYIRFLDMKRFGNYQIYNRQVYGILYKQTLQNVKYEFRNWLTQNFPEMLNQIS